MITLDSNSISNSINANPHYMVEPFTPPLPLLLCLVAAAGAVIASFIVLIFFYKNTQAYSSYPKFDLMKLSFFGYIDRANIKFIIQLFSVFLFIIVVLSGFIGSSDPVYNIAPTFVWVIWWVGLAYVSAFVGNLWSLINPWKIIFEWCEKVFSLFVRNNSVSMRLSYPSKLKVWPAVLLFVIFAWIENVYPGAIVPSKISLIILVYSIITWAGMLLFGKETWLRNGEVFTLVFGYLSRFAPIQGKAIKTTAGKTGASSKMKNHLFLRPPSSGLLDIKSVSISETLLILLLLATVTFDGFAGTKRWLDVQIYIEQYSNNITLINTGGLISTIVIFFVVYFAFAKLMKLTSGNLFSARHLATTFVCTLIPIALAYHVAHFLMFLLIQGQTIIPLASDPFGFDWNIFNTTLYRVNFMLASPNFYWGTSIISILIGHIIAVFLSHSIAMRLFKSHSSAIRSQYPMLILMVGYTVASLWIITQPMYV